MALTLSNLPNRGSSNEDFQLSDVDLKQRRRIEYADALSCCVAEQFSRFQDGWMYVYVSAEDAVEDADEVVPRSIKQLLVTGPSITQQKLPASESPRKERKRKRERGGQWEKERTHLGGLGTKFLV